MIFLPGYIAIKAINIRGVIRITVFSFALSLIINYCLVFALTSLGLYKRLVLFVIFGIEVLLFIRMIYPSLSKPVLIFNIPTVSSALSMFKYSWKSSYNAFSILVLLMKYLLAVLSILTFLWYLEMFVLNFGGVFSEWDPVMSWNRWAVDWYHGDLPVQTWRYPQLLPANWSLTYLFMDNKIEFFAKAIMPLFELSILLLMFDLALKEKKPGYFIGIVATGVILKILMGPFLASGYADVPTAFFAYLAIYCILSSQKESPELRTKILLLGAFSAAGAAVTKQAGWIVAITYPLLSFVIVLRFAKDLTSLEKMKKIIAMLIVIITVTAPWYVYKELAIRKGAEFSEFAALQGLSSVAQAFNLMCGKIPIEYIMVFIALPVCLSLLTRAYLIINLVIVLPVTVFWFRYLGYDIRNLALVLPLIGASVGMGFQNLLDRGERLYGQLRGQEVESGDNAANQVHNLSGSLPQSGLMFEIKVYQLIAAAAIFIVVLTSQYSEAVLIDRQTNLQKQLGYANLNEILYKYHATEGLSGKIMTHYQYLGHLPGLEKYYRFYHYKDYDIFDRQRKELDTRYLLFNTLPGWGVLPEIYDDINKKLRNGEYQLISEKNYWLFIRIR